MLDLLASLAGRGKDEVMEGSGVHCGTTEGSDTFDNVKIQGDGIISDNVETLGEEGMAAAATDVAAEQLDDAWGEDVRDAKGEEEPLYDTAAGTEPEPLQEAEAEAEPTKKSFREVLSEWRRKNGRAAGQDACGRALWGVQAGQGPPDVATATAWPAGSLGLASQGSVGRVGDGS